MLRKEEALLNDSPYFSYHLENKVSITTCLSRWFFCFLFFLAVYRLLLVHLSWSFSRYLFYGFNNHNDCIKTPYFCYVDVSPLFLWIAKIFLFWAFFLMIPLIISIWVQVLNFNQFICSHSLYILLVLVIVFIYRQLWPVSWPGMALARMVALLFLSLGRSYAPDQREFPSLFWSGCMFTSVYVILLKYISPSYMERK